LAESFGLDAVRRALIEDQARHDVTTRLLGPAAERRAEAGFVIEERAVAAGVPLAALVFQELDPAAAVSASVAEGSWADAGTVIATASAIARALLGGERVALNFVQRLSGIATLTRHAVEAVRGTPARITHTRKTTPGLRALELYAVKAGGGVENRASLADAIMWKDNHWALLNGGSLRQALRDVPRDDRLIVEVESEMQLDEALAAGVTHLLVDNQPPARLAAWAGRAGPAVTIQASGGITLENVRAYAEAGATVIAIGALTHSARAVAIRCEIA
jgi:nicotinate-nucleotide pyrophosphorylase (carboxylating)